MENAETDIPRNPKGDLTSNDIRSHLIRLSVPMIWGIAAIISFQLVDTYFISKLGKTELAAISFTFPVTYFLFSFTMGFGIAMSSVASRLIGQGRINDVRRVTTHGLLLGSIVAVIVTFLGMLLHDSVFLSLGASPEMTAIIREYMMIWFAGNAFFTIPLIGNSSIRATGDTFSPALVMCLAAGINVALDPLLIFGGFGIPAMGMKGAALSTVFGNACALIACIYILGSHKKLLLPLSDLRLEKFKDSLRRLLVIALPVGVTNGISPLVGSAIVAFLAMQGESAVAAYGVATRVEAFAFVILMALAIGMAPIVGQNWGANKPMRVLETIRLVISFNILWSPFIAVLLALSSYKIASLFSTDPEIIRLTVLFFWIVPVSYLFSNLVNGWCSVFNAIGKPQRSLTMIVLKMLVLTLPCVWLGGRLLGTYGIFLAIAAVNTASGLAFHLWSWHTFTRRDSALNMGAKDTA